jgi:plastocyanin
MVLRQLICALALVSACSLAGCKPDAAVKDPSVVGRGSREQANPPASEPQNASGDVPGRTSALVPAAASGSIVGSIFFKGSAPPKTIDTSMDPACALGAKGKLPTEQYVVKGGKLANVYLYLKSGPPEAMQSGPAPAAPVVLDQVHCQYTPHVIAVMQGGYVEFRNSDPTMHNVHTQPSDIGNETIDISEGPRGHSQTKPFLKPETMIPVRCNNHPWMNAFVNVSATPYFAVSDADGRFELRGLPPGQYTLAAVHEKLGEKTMQITVTAKTATKADFSFAQ